MNLELPSWSRPKRPAAGEAGEAGEASNKSARAGARDAIRGKGGQGAVEALVAVLTKLVLTNARELADLTSTVYRTWEVYMDNSVAKGHGTGRGRLRRRKQ